MVDYDFGNFTLHATVPPVRVDGGLRREVAEAPRQNQLAIASLNVENLAATE